MSKQAIARTIPFLASKAYLKTRLDIDMPLDDFIEKAYYIWRMIGNTATYSKAITLTVPEDRIIQLPSDVKSIRSVTSSTISNLKDTGTNYSYNSKGVVNEVRPSMGMGINTDVDDTGGDSVAYELHDGYIKVQAEIMVGRTIKIVYNIVETDEDGLPFLNDKEVIAIALNVAAQKAEMDLFKKIQGADRILNYIKPLAENALVAAKTDELISDDGLDHLLNIKTSWDRKQYGERLKF